MSRSDLSRSDLRFGFFILLANDSAKTRFPGDKEGISQLLCGGIGILEIRDPP
jgi:hypothetical protein